MWDNVRGRGTDVICGDDVGVPGDDRCVILEGEEGEEGQRVESLVLY